MITLKFNRPPSDKNFDRDIKFNVIYFPLIEQEQFCYARVEEDDLAAFIAAYGKYNLGVANEMEMPDVLLNEKNRMRYFLTIKSKNV